MNLKYKLSLAMLLLQTAASAAVLLDQPLAFIDGRSSNTINGTQGFQTWDRISVADSSLITRVSWVGAFADFTNTANNPVVATGDEWHIDLASDNANSPGANAYNSSFAFGSVAQTLLGVGTLSGQAASFYRFTADLLTPMFMAGGQSMWLTIYSVNDTLDPTFAWISGSGGDGVAKQFLFSNGSLVGNYTDRALTLEGSAVPEPGTYALIGAGCLLIVILRRPS